MCRDRAEEVQRIRLVAPLLVRTGTRQCALGKGVRLLQTPGQHLRLAEGQRTGCVKARRCRRHGLFHRRGEELHGVGDAPGEEIRRTQGRRHPGEIDREVRVLTEVHGLFEPGECSGQIPLAQAQQANAPRGVHAAREVIHGLGNPESFVPEGSPLSEHP